MLKILLKHVMIKPNPENSGIKLEEREVFVNGLLVIMCGFMIGYRNSELSHYA